MIELYPFQQEDVYKLVDRKGRIIASEMGSGKTYVAGELDMLNCDDQSCTLWVGPMQTLESSRDKMRELNYNGPAVILNPKDREGSWQQYKRAGRGIFFVHWEALRLMPQLKQMYWTHVVADECHRMQNRKAQQTQALKKIPSVFKTAMSGTPVTGEPDKYWSVLNWLYPRDWGSYWKFHERFTEYELVYPQGYHKVIGPKNEHELHELVRPYYVRHLKKEQCCPHHPNGVMPWLPSKYYTIQYVDLDPKQRRAYDQMRKEMIAWVGAHENSPLVANVVVAQMMRLQQFALAYASVDASGFVQLVEPSSKADAVMQILEDNPNEPIVVFTQFTKMIRLLANRLQKARIPYSVYTGENRTTRDLVDKPAFIRGDTRVLLGTIGAGGVGVDGLQEVSSTVIFTDRMWNPSLNNQAEDRLWRDGQDNAVQVIDIIARGTVDLGRMQRLEMKWDWIKRLLGDK